MWLTENQMKTFQTGLEEAIVLWKGRWRSSSHRKHLPDRQMHLTLAVEELTVPQETIGDCAKSAEVPVEALVHWRTMIRLSF